MVVVLYMAILFEAHGAYSAQVVLTRHFIKEFDYFEPKGARECVTIKRTILLTIT